MLVTLVQQNPIVGDLKGNIGIVSETLKCCTGEQLVVFSELFLTGYPPKALLTKGDFLQDVDDAYRKVREITKDYPLITVVLGMPWRDGEKLYNSAVVLKNGETLAIHHKTKLTRFALFDEYRYFSVGDATNVIKVGDTSFGIALGLELDRNVISVLKEAGASFIINPMALPFQLVDDHQYKIKGHAMENKIAILVSGQVGANDELIFSGGSCAFNGEGQFIGRMEEFKQGVISFALDCPQYIVANESIDKIARVYQALVLGIKDYVQKSGMSKVILGLSGGLDSAVVAVLATEALGRENVWAITQPGPFSGSSSVEDASSLAKNLGIRFSVLPITDLYESTLDNLGEFFAGTSMGVAEENIQARLRGLLWMTLSNKFGGLVLTNSNKSELAVGYCTLYGDMNGGLAVLGDVYKTMVYELAHYINQTAEVIPSNTITKPPSAELRPDQRDDETLPPYDILDGIIKSYLDENKSISQIIAEGYDEEVVQWVTSTINNNDYKRRQAALVLRITEPVLNFGRDMPLAARKNY
ncbi:MAG: NAD+ synthase [Bacillota bacterium]|nr:NAD+ synthase [Bacillota bacterium]